jgi:hypothetical protein
MRKRRQQYGGVYLDPRTQIWYYRRSVNGRRGLDPIGKLSDYPTKALAEKASNTFKTDVPKPVHPTFEYAARHYMAERMPAHPPTAMPTAITSRTTASPGGVPPAWLKLPRNRS